MIRPSIGRVSAFVVVCATVMVTAAAVRADYTIATSSYGPTGYRGIVSANFNTATAAEEIVGDFGPLGVWAYEAGVWSRLTATDPEWVFAIKRGSGDYGLVADFGDLGMWTWHHSGYPGTWTRITATDPYFGMAVDDDGDGKDELQVQFWGLGVWRYDLDTSTWVQLTASIPDQLGLRVDIWTAGQEEGLWDFGSLGLWAVNWNGGGPTWNQLSASDALPRYAAADFLTASGSSGELVVTFSGLGTWLYGGDSPAAGTWTQLTSAPLMAAVPVKFGPDAATDLVGAPSYRPWLWRAEDGWLQMSSAYVDSGFAVPFDSDGLAEAFPEEEVAGDFGTSGLWLYNYTVGGVATRSWTQLTPSNPTVMVSSDYYGDGKRTSLVASFGAAVGLWIYDSGGGARAAAWRKLSDSAPEAITFWR